MATYETGLKHDPENQELKDGFMRCLESMDKVAHGKPEDGGLGFRVLGTGVSGFRAYSWGLQRPWSGWSWKLRFAVAIRGGST